MDQFRIVTEGRATVLAPKADKVFYNPIQQFNRDLSVMAIQAWMEEYKQSKVGQRELKAKRKRGDAAAVKRARVAEDNAEVTADTELKAEKTDGRTFETQPTEPTSDNIPFVRILEALSATGLRAIRYGHEIPQVARIVANDLLAEATKSITRSVAHNGLENIITANQGDAIKYMASVSEAEKFHVVDLDPYGTAAPFLEGAVQSVRDGGLLLVTCTDAGVLAGSGYPEKCFALYGGNNLGNTAALEANHEAGIRLILGALAQAGARHKKCIEPVLSLSIDYYFRVFVRVSTSALQVKQLASQTMLAYHCVGCGNVVQQRMGRAADNKFHTARATAPGAHCAHCDRPHHLAGPMWGGELHLAPFVDRVLAINSAADPAVYGTRERIKGMLTMARAELPHPFYVNLNQVLSFFRAPPVPIDDFARAAGNLGHAVLLTHAKKNCVKTSAPWEDVLAIFVAWLRRSNRRLVAEMAARLQKESDDTKRARIADKIAALEADLGSNPNLTEGMVGYKLLRNVERKDIDFDRANEQSEKVARLRKLKMVRYQENPTKNWGPMARPAN